MSAAHQNLPLVPAIEDDPETEDDEYRLELPARTIGYQWNKLRIRVTPEETGSVFEAELEYEEDDGRAEYRALGVFPAVPCAEDDDCREPENGLIARYRQETRCDPDFGYCVLSQL